MQAIPHGCWSLKRVPARVDAGIRGEQGDQAEDQPSDGLGQAEAVETP